jgi:hypothetical protein
MLSIFFLLSLFINGILICHFIFKKVHGLLFIVGSFVIGTLATMTLLYISANISHDLRKTFWFYSITWILIPGIIYKQKLFLKRMHLLFFEKFDLLFLPVLVGSFLLFMKSFSYDVTNGTFQIASNLYVDFGAHISFIRSFSLGNNFPSEVPFFANSGLQYHFLFDFSTAILEFLGVRIDNAYNFLSALAFTCIISMLYLWGRLIGDSRKVGILTCILFLLQSSLAFVPFFEQHGLSLSVIKQNNIYVGNFPFEKGLIAGFWNMNTYLNQRQLIFGLASMLFFTNLFFSKNILLNRQYVQIILGLLISLLPLWHVSTFISLIMVLFVTLLFDKKRRKQLLPIFITAGLASLPWLFMISHNSHNSIILQPGFLIDFIHQPLRWFIFWGVNLGVSIITIVLGLIYAPSEKKKYAFFLIPLFLLPNIIHISGRHPFDDHKFFNLWIAFMNCYSAFFLVLLYKKSVKGKIISGCLLILLVASGIINTFVIKNDVYTSIQDYPKNKFLTWSIKNIPSDKVMLTNGEIYDPLSLIGKKLYLGRIQYINVYGGNVDKRLLVKQTIYTIHDKKKIKKLLKDNSISFLVIYKEQFAKNSLSTNPKFFKKFMHTLYEDKDAIVLTL